MKQKKNVEKSYFSNCKSYAQGITMLESVVNTHLK